MGVDIVTETKARKPLTVNWPGRGMVILADDEKATDGVNAYRKACALARGAYPPGGRAFRHLRAWRPGESDAPVREAWRQTG